MKENILPVAIEDKMKKSYLSYSLSVIIDRALPDVRDGLKPVHRRILYASKELGLTHDKSHKKSARIVGEVLGKYHPHGDGAVYDAMVRMAQDFNQRYLLIDGHGNFGSIDGDSAAAMRYTEARLTGLAEELLSDIKEGTTDYTDNFDGSLQEPVTLPSRIPNLLVNGSSGIAVGMSTSIPPHNLSEVIDALVYLLKHPSAKLETLMNHLPGPDFPTGAKIIGEDGIISAYQTGQGKITLRAKTEIEKKGRKEQIIITEIPYQLNKSKLIEEIAELINKGKVNNISDLRDESDQEGLRVVLELKTNADSELILNRLFKYSSLQSSYRINLLALHNNKPLVMNLKTILQHFIDFRRDVITRRTNYKLDKAKERYHILQGLIKAIDELDLVISIIRNSKSTDEASKSLQKKLDITEIQARAILQMQLQRLVGMEVKKLEAELAELKGNISYFQKILNKQTELDKLLKSELQEIKKKYGDRRRTEIIADEEKAVINQSDLIKEKEAVISLSYRQNLKRTDSLENIRPAKNDYIVHTTSGSSLDNLLFFTRSGEVYSLPIHKITEHHSLSTGDHLNKFIQIPLHEKIVKVLVLKKQTQNQFITITTRQGMVKKSLGSEYLTNYSNIKAIKLNDDDYVINVEVTDGQQEILLGSYRAMTIRFKEDTVSDTGRYTFGNKGIKLDDHDFVVSMNLISNNQYVVSITDTGKANRSRIEDYTLQNRNGKGLRTASSTIYNLAGVITANPDDRLLVVSSDEKIYPVKVADITETSRPGNMYQLIKLENGEQVTNVIKLPYLPEGEDEVESEE